MKGGKKGGSIGIKERGQGVVERERGNREVGRKIGRRGKGEGVSDEYMFTIYIII